jgi:hypothetical protein
MQYAIFGIELKLVIFPTVDPVDVNCKSGMVNDLKGTRSVFCGIAPSKEQQQQETDMLQHGTAAAASKRNGHCQ